MRVMVTGATGFLGGHLLAQLHAAGAGISAIARSPEAARQLAQAGVRPVHGALDDAVELREAMVEATDCVFNVAADTSSWRGHAERQMHTNVEGTRAVLAAAQACGVRRFVHTSSVSAYGQQDGVLDEDSPRLGVRSWITYERSKALAEDLVLEAGARGAMETVIVNPAHVLGPGDRHNWARLFLLIDQEKLPGAPPGSGAFADVREVARAQVAAALRPVAGRRYLLGGEHASFLELVQMIASTLGRKVPARALPATLLRMHARVLDLASMVSGREPQLTPQAVSYTCHNLRVDSTRAIRDLDYRLTPLSTLVEETCAWLRGHGMLRAR